MEIRKLTDQEIYEMNMEEIERYFREYVEYERKGYWTAFMGVEIDSPPSKPKLLKYNNGR